jgi:hypothetical protein
MPAPSTGSLLHNAITEQCAACAFVAIAVGVVTAGPVFRHIHGTPTAHVAGVDVVFRQWDADAIDAVPGRGISEAWVETPTAVGVMGLEINTG